MTIKCEHTDKGDGHFFCEHCHQMGLKADLMIACPYNSKINLPIPAVWKSKDPWDNPEYMG